jgi:hypothetical protein
LIQRPFRGFRRDDPAPVKLQTPEP